MALLSGARRLRMLESAGVVAAARSRRHIEVQRQVAHTPDNLVGAIPDRAKGVQTSALCAPPPARLCVLGCLSPLPARLR